VIWIRDESGAAAAIDLDAGGAVRSLTLRADGDTALVPVLTTPTVAESEPGAQNSEPCGAGAAVPVAAGSGTTAARDPRTVAAMGDLFAGRWLAPFADRIPGGVYDWYGADYRIAPNDHETGDAIHGFLYRCPLEVVSQSASRVRLVGEMPATEGYPWRTRAEVSCAIRASRLDVELAVTCLEGPGSPAPVTIGWHPYFRHPDGLALINDAVLEVPADRYLEADDDLALTGRRPAVAGSAFDFRRPRPIGAVELDVALERDGNDGPARQADTSPVGASPAGASPVMIARLGGREREVVVEADGAFGRVQLFVPPDRDCIALEPVSAPAAAFSDPGLGPAALYPGDSIRGSARVSLRRRGDADFQRR